MTTEHGAVTSEPQTSEPQTSNAPSSPQTSQQASTAVSKPQKNWTKKGCHTSRDVYYQCYHREGGNEERCKEERDRMFAECPLSWAKFFTGKVRTQRHVDRLEGLTNKMNKDMGSPLGGQGPS